MTFTDKKSVFWSTTMMVKFLVLMLSVLARVNGQWDYVNDSESVESLQEGANCRIKTGEAGICRRLSECGVYYEGLKQKTIKYNFLVRCSFINTDEVICCPQDDKPAQTSDRLAEGWGKFREPTGRPTLKPTAATPTSMRPIVVGDKTIIGNEPFIDLSKILKSTTTQRPRQIRLVPAQESTMNSNRQPMQPNFNAGNQNPWLNNANIKNNNQWPDGRVPQSQERPAAAIQQNKIRFPTEPTIWKPPQGVPVDPDVEVFNTIDTNGDSSSAKLVQFPGPMIQPPSQSFGGSSFPKTEPVVVEQNDIFEQFKFRPGSEDSNIGGNTNSGGNSLGWLTPNTERSVRTTTRRTTTTTTTQLPVLTNWMKDALNQGGNVNAGEALSWPTPNTERSVRTTTQRTTVTTTAEPVLTNWMMDALNQSPSTFTTTSTSRPQTPVTVIPFSITSAVTKSPPPDAVTFTSRDDGSDRPSQAACKRYRNFNPAGLTFHILDGVPVAPGEFPHIGGLIFPQGGGTEVDNRCGSSLISERYVMTAAHCVYDPLALPTFVRFGVVVWNSKDIDNPPVDAEIENIILHPEYRSHLRYHDIALIKLRNNVEFTLTIRPGCLMADMADIDSNTQLVVIGWGVTNVQTRARSEQLLKTEVNTVALQDCNATHIAYGTSRAYRSGLNEGHYCAYDPELKKDACQSDSGGPLHLVRDKQPTIVGIVSFGLSCGSAIPSVYVRVAYYLDWIESIVWST